MKYNDLQRLERLLPALMLISEELNDLRDLGLEWREFRPATVAGAADNLLAVVREHLAEAKADR